MLNRRVLRQFFDNACPRPQRAFRPDGKRVVDGAGTASAFHNDPNSFAFPDSLECVRKEIEAALLSGDQAFVNFVASLVSFEPQANLSAEQAQQFETLLHSVVEDVFSRLGSLLGPEILERPKVADCQQPFRLPLILLLAQWTDDADIQIVSRVWEGILLGDDEPIEPSHIFPSAKKGEIDESEDFLVWNQPYDSFQSFVNAETLLEEQVQRGFVAGPMTWPAMREFLGLQDSVQEPDAAQKSVVHPDLAAGRLGAVPKDTPEGILLKDLPPDLLRLIFDNTISKSNVKFCLPEKITMPMLEDVKTVLPPDFDSFLTAKWDVLHAFYNLILKILERRRTLMKTKKGWHAWKCCPMGTRSSGYFWCRFFALLHRLSHALISDREHAGAFIVDDSLWFASVHTKANQRPSQQSIRRALLSLLIVIVFQAVLGVPFSYKKFYFGFKPTWAGYQMDTLARTAGITSARLHKYRSFAEDILGSASFVRRPTQKELQSLASKLSWAAQVMPPVRAFFHSLFAAAHGDPQYHLPSRLRQDIELIFKMLSSASQIPVSPRVSVPTLCRVDAMASTNQCFIGGWFVCLSWLQGKPLTASWLFENAKWFLFEIPHSSSDSSAWHPSDIDPDFDPIFSGDSAQKYVSAAETLANAVALALWHRHCHTENWILRVARVESDSMVAVQASEKWYSRKKNMATALQALAAVCVGWNLRPKITHVPGVKNKLADAISRVCSVDPTPQIRTLTAHLRPENRCTVLPALPFDLPTFQSLRVPPWPH